MDLFTLILLILFFFVLPAIGRMMEQKRKQAPPEKPREMPEGFDEVEVGYGTRQQSSRAPEDESLAEALRQIREALGQPAPTAERRPEPPRPAPRPTEPPSRPQPQARPTPPQPQRQAPPPPRPRTQPPARKATRFEKLKLPEIDLDAPLEVQVVAGGAAEQSWLVKLLRDPVEARKAFKMHEVLQPPLAFKRVGIRRRRP